jgi:hypothetical protein
MSGGQDVGYSGPLASYDGVLMSGVNNRLFGRPQTLFDWLDTMAWDGDSTPGSFDAVSFGLQRLVHAGLVTLRRDRNSRLVIAPTPLGTELLKRARYGRVYRGQIADRITDEFAKTMSLADDRSLGRYPDLDEREWSREISHWHRVFWQRARPWLALSELLHRYLRWRHPEDFPE